MLCVSTSHKNISAPEIPGFGNFSTPQPPAIYKLLTSDIKRTHMGSKQKQTKEQQQ
jgi:hypothetical protein